MAKKRCVATVTAMAFLTGACSTESQPQPPPPSSSTVETMEVPRPPGGYIGPWPSVNECPQQGVYALTQDPSPGLACSVGAVIKGRIDKGEEVNYISYKGEVTYVNDLGSCVLNMLVEETVGNETKSMHVGLVRVGEDNSAEALFFPYKSTAPFEVKPATLQPTEYGVYATLEDSIPVPIGLSVGQSFCQLSAPSSPIPVS